MITLSSPAKINLFLEVLGRRADGYHTLSTLFQEITLADTLSVRGRADGRIVLSATDPALPVGEENLVARAARAARAAFPGAPGFSFKLTKRIPVGAGLGGGSSNAATALKACWALATGERPGKFPWKTLWPLARSLGADVSFFLRGGLARAGGVGDRLTFLRDTGGKRRHFVLVFPRVFSSTPVAYRALSFPLTARRSGLRLTRALLDGAEPRVWAPWLFNRLEEAVLPRLAPVARAKRALLRAGCLNAIMSGSGSSVFGVVDNLAHGERVLSQIKREPWDCWRVSAVYKSASTADEVTPWKSARFA